MKKILLVSAALAVFAGQAMADGIYVAGKLGGSNGEANSIEPNFRYTTPTANFQTLSEHDFTDNVLAWGGAVGYEYDKWLVPLRMEVEYLYRNHYNYATGFNGLSVSDIELTSHVNTSTVLANFFVDVPVNKMFGFTFGAGLGEAINTSTSKLTGSLAAGQDVRGTEDQTGFSWMGTAGIFVKPLKWLTMDLSYRYSGLGDVNWRVGQANGIQGELQTDSFAAQELFFGVRAMIPNMIKKHRHHKKPHTYMDK